MKSQVRIPKIGKKQFTKEPRFSIEDPDGTDLYQRSSEKTEVSTGNMVPYKYRRGNKTWGVNENYR